MDAILTARDIRRSFQVGNETIQVLGGISLEIPRNAITVLRGRSGSGKTTLMNILSTLDPPTSGQVFFEGEELTAVSEERASQLRRTKMGFIFQSVALVGMMSAAENVDFALRIAGLSPKEREQRVHECLSLVGLGGKGAHMPQELSGGEQQRVAIARALAHSPGVIFADEPTAELDSLTGMQVVKIFLEMKKSTTLVIATHDEAVAAAADCVYEIEDGVLK
ncbi:MAG: ABC transporter ATP-binding protein [Oscillospiraceae bacterium]|nr:ABC transporter ATP-binding protein [Oscillospiraceae bacterium]